jgi:hypothetical protein
MKSPRRTTGILVTAALATGVAVAPVVAAQGPQAGRGPNATCQKGDGAGTQARKGKANKKRMRATKKARFANKKSGTLTAAQKRELAAMAEEEKLAHDVYVTLATQYPDVIQFSRIPNAEARHLAAIQKMLTRYGLDDPTEGTEVGEFATPATQDLYDQFVTQATSRQAALDVGVAIEKQDIKDLKAAKVGLKAPDVRFVYNRLLEGSKRHLVAFRG